MSAPTPRRLLWVKAGRLLPVDTGGKLRSFHLASQLAARHQLTMLTYYEGPRDPAYEAAMEKAFPGAVTIRYGSPGNGKLSTGLRYLASLPDAAPFAVRKFTAPEVRRRITDWAAEGRFDAMICDFLSASLNFDDPEGTPTILFQHNVESALWTRQASHAPNPLLKVVYSLEAAKMRRYEQRAVQRFRQVVAVSEHDRQLMSAMVDPARITVVPTGVDSMRFGEKAGQEPGGPVVLFLGSMDWEANIDGAEWMVEHIWPIVQAAVPDATFRIVGRNPHARVKRLAGRSVDVTGSVPSVDGYLMEAAVFVVPLRIGGGTRLKIFEGMAAGRAVVSTTVGAEGLPVTHGRDILLEDEPRTFADAVIRVLKDPALRRRLGGAALELAREHDWSRVVAAMEGVVDRVSSQVEGDATRVGRVVA